MTAGEFTAFCRDGVQGAFRSYQTGWRAGGLAVRLSGSGFANSGAPRSADIGGAPQPDPTLARDPTPLSCTPRNALGAGVAGGPPPILCPDDRTPPDYRVGERIRDYEERRRALDDATIATQRQILKRRHSPTAPATPGELRLLERQQEAIDRQKALNEIYKPTISP